MAAPQIVTTLTRKYSSLLGELREAEARCRDLRAKLAHVEGAIALFDPAWNASAVEPTRPYRKARLFKHGQASRVAMAVLRDAEGPMTAGEIAVAVMQRCGVTDASEAVVANCIAVTLKNKIGKTVGADDSSPRRWWIQPME